MLRAARLLLVGSAAAAIGSIAFIARQATAFSPLLLVFAAAAALFLLAAVTLERDPRRGRLLAAAAACALAGIGTLAGMGAGEVTFPAAALGVLAAWCAAMWRTPRWVRVAFLASLVAGLLVNATRLLVLLFFPFLLPSVLVWPITAALFVPGIGPLVAIYGAIGLSVALAVAAFAPPVAFAPRPDARLLARDAAVAGVVFVGLEVALAFAQPNTSARDELVPVAIAVIFVAGALLALGVRLLRRGVPGGLVATFLGATTLVYIVSARPTVVCEPNGASESSGPWWMPYGGGMRSVGGGVRVAGAAAVRNRTAGIHQRKEPAGGAHRGTENYRAAHQGFS